MLSAPDDSEAQGLEYTIRLARSCELSALPEIEMAAAQRFRHSAHPAAAEGVPISVGLHATWIAHEGVWVAESPSGELAAFLCWRPLALDMYVVELDVHPDHAGQRLSARMLDAVAAYGGRLGFTRLVLRTFRDVPWNGPYYRKLGFAPLEERAEPAELASIRAEEASIGLDDRVRDTLYRDIPPEPLSGPVA